MNIPLSSDLLDSIVLSLLNQKDYYGYELTSEIKKYLPISESTLYPVLRRLKQKALLTTYDQAFNGRNRRYYSINEAGKKQLSISIEEWKDYKKNIDILFNIKGE